MFAWYARRLFEKTVFLCIDHFQAVAVRTTLTAPSQEGTVRHGSTSHFQKGTVRRGSGSPSQEGTLRARPVCGGVERRDRDKN